jgi:hypothetical protein
VESGFRKLSSPRKAVWFFTCFLLCWELDENCTWFYANLQYKFIPYWRRHIRRRSTSIVGLEKKNNNSRRTTLTERRVFFFFILKKRRHQFSACTCVPPPLPTSHSSSSVSGFTYEKYGQPIHWYVVWIYLWKIWSADTLIRRLALLMKNMVSRYIDTSSGFTYEKYGQPIHWYYPLGEPICSALCQKHAVKMPVRTTTSVHWSLFFLKSLNCFIETHVLMDGWVIAQNCTQRLKHAHVIFVHVVELQL